MSPAVYMGTLALVLGAIVLVTAIRTLSTFTQAKAKIAAETGYRDLAEKMSASQAETASILSDLKVRIANIEALLKTVE